MELTNEEIKLLAEGERKMDAGEIAFVRLAGNRASVSPDVMQELGLQQGQTINNTIFLAILEANIANCKARMRPN